MNSPPKGIEVVWSSHLNVYHVNEKIAISNLGQKTNVNHTIYPKVPSSLFSREIFSDGLPSRA